MHQSTIKTVSEPAQSAPIETKHKITDKEQSLLSQKKIVMGLSVGSIGFINISDGEVL